MKEYDQSFFDTRHKGTQHAADAILSATLAALPPVASAVDVGCGVGTWLATLQTDDVWGVDGPWVDQGLLAIPADKFEVRDVSKPMDFGRRFDLAISLEVGEHIPASSASPFVDSLTGASDFVLFSAAIPGQGGRHHVNEQWPHYWAKLFAQRGYHYADFRPKIWNDGGIPYWYRQNVILYARESRAGEVRLDVHSDATPCSLVHPVLYEAKCAETIKRGVSMTGRAVKRRLGL